MANVNDYRSSSYVEFGTKGASTTYKMPTGNIFDGMFGRPFESQRSKRADAAAAAKPEHPWSDFMRAKYYYAKCSHTDRDLQMRPIRDVAVEVSDAA